MRLGRWSAAERFGVRSMIALASMGVASVALAGGSRIVLLSEQAGDDAIIARAQLRLAAELRAAGFEVEEGGVDAQGDARRIVETPASGDPFATVFLRRAGDGTSTDVWVADHVTHKTVVRSVSVPGSGESADRALALRVVELVRASLVEATVLPSADVTTTPAPDVKAQTREKNQMEPAQKAGGERITVGLGVAAAFASPDVGLAVAPALRVAWRAGRLWVLRVAAVGPAVGGRVQRSEGDATIRQEMGLLDLSFDPQTAGRIQGYAALGAGAYHIDERGNAAAPFAGVHDEAWAALASAGGGIRLRLSRVSSIELESRLLFAMPRPVVFFGSERVAAAMHPGALATLSVTVDL
jgi:hypothetical protein